ncbi:MAG: hypothetical protein ACK4N5_04345, partial [Myxococcales bacterium]
MAPLLPTLLTLVLHAGGLSLQDAVAQGLAAHPELQVARARLGHGEADLLAARRLLPANPVLHAECARDISPEEFPNFRYGASLTQQVEVAGQRGLRIDRA